MERRKAAGAVRNTERSRQKFLAAVGKIIKKSGFSALKINHIATVAKLDKKMIYKYFGGLDNLLEEYLLAQNFWQGAEDSDLSIQDNDGGRAFSKQTILAHFDFVHTNPEFQKVLLWGLSEQRQALKQLSEKQEESGELLFQEITDPHFKDKSEKFRSVMAVLVAGSYYLNLHAAYNGTPFCGIDVKEDAGMEKIKESLAFLIDQTYTGL